MQPDRELLIGLTPEIEMTLYFLLLLCLVVPFLFSIFRRDCAIVQRHFCLFHCMWITQTPAHKKEGN